MKGGKAMDRFLNRTVCVGVLNPKGEKDEKLTTYFTETQLQGLERRINDRRFKPLPVYINHNTHSPTGEDIVPCGEVVQAKVNPQHGKLCVSVVLYDNENGKLADRLVRDEKIPMRQFSLGYNIVMKNNEDGLPIPIDKQAIEVSLCYRGARESTNIGTVTRMGDLLKETPAPPKVSPPTQSIAVPTVADMLKKNVSGSLFSEPPIKKQKSMLSFNEMIGKAADPKNDPDMALASQLMNMPSYNMAAQHALLAITENMGTSIVSATASAADAMETDVVSASTSAPVPSASAPSEPRTKESMEARINQVLQTYGDKVKTANDPTMEAALNNLRGFIAPKVDKVPDMRMDRGSTQIQEIRPELIRTFQERIERRPKISETTDEETKKYLLAQFAREDQEMNSELERAQREADSLRSNIQRDIQDIIPHLVEARKAKGEAPLTDTELQSIREFYAQIPTMGEKMSGAMAKIISAQASYKDEAGARIKQAANIVEESFQKELAMKSALIDSQQEIDTLKSKTDELEKQLRALSENSRLGVLPGKRLQEQQTIGATASYASDQKKIRTAQGQTAPARSQQGTPINVHDLIDKMNKYGRAGFQASVFADPKAPLQEHLDRAANFNGMEDVFGNRPYNPTPYLDNMKRRMGPSSRF